ncbi:titin-like [Mya arenaria]|uniref:titin-like n=1 Tax=Mya arenaria TaxID=6604 RepID=UPI0022E15D20|nr:titin-like [Mya arenaria]
MTAMRTAHYFDLLVICVSLTRTCYGIGEDCTLENCSGSGEICVEGNCACDSSTHYQAQVGTQCSAKGTSIGGACTVPGLGSIGSACSASNSQCTGSSGEGQGTCSCLSGNYQSATNVCSPIGTSIWGSCTVPRSGSSGNPCSSQNSICTGSSGEGLGTCSCLSGYYPSATNVCSQIGTSIGVSCTKPSSGSIGSPCSAPASQCTGTSGEGAGTCSCLSGYYPSATNVCSTIGTSIGASCTKPSSGSSGNPCSATNTQCTGSSGEGAGSCSCLYQYYQSVTNVCSPQVGLGSQCTMKSACLNENSDCLGHQSGSGSTCQCTNNYFDTNTVDNIQGSCIRKITLDSRCDTSHSNLAQCAADNAICDSRYSYACKCRYGYYVDPSNTAKCKARQPLGGNCQYNTDCTDSNAECASSKCRCVDGFYDTNGIDMDGICKSVVELRVTNINFQGITTSQFSVSWVIPDEKGQYIQTFVVEWMPKDNTFGDGGTKTLSGSPTTALIDSGISAGKSYTVKITSINSQLGVNRSVFSSADQDAKPNPPTWKEATDVNPANDHTITVSWNAPSGSVYGYQVSLVDGSTPVLSTAVLQSTSTKLFSTQIKNGHFYTVQIISKSQSNTVDSVPLKHVIKTEVIAPGPPTGANCKDVKDEFIIVGWNAPVVPNGDLRQCFVHVYNTSGLVKIVGTDAIINELKVSGLDPGTYYTFKIYTQNELFNSTSSDATHCQTNARMSDPPEDLSASAVSSRGFTVSWQKPVNTYSEEILGYLLQVKAGETCVVERQFKCSNCYVLYDVSENHMNMSL